MSEQREVWGPWIEHDGKGCPCPGAYVGVVREFRGAGEIIAGAQFDGTEARWGSSWHWAVQPVNELGQHWDRILRYRVRKPRGLAILEERLALVGAPQRERVPA